MSYETFIDGLIAGINTDAPPVIMMLYPALLQPINETLLSSTTITQLRALRATAARQTETPLAILSVIDAYIALYTALQEV